MDLPDPAAPTRARVSPGSTRSVNPSSSGAAAGSWPKTTPSHSRAGGPSGSRSATSGSVTPAGASMMSSTRSAPARACCHTVSRVATWRTGATKEPR